MPFTAQTVVPGDITPDHLRGAWSCATLSCLHGHTMGTYWNLRWQDQKRCSPAVIQTCLQGAFDLIIAQMSHYDSDSELSRINLSPADHSHHLSDEFFHVLQRALELSRLTGGAYNPNLAALSSSFGFGPDPTFLPPSAASFAEPWTHIQLDPEKHTLTHDLERLHLDLSSIAKGYALDIAARELQFLGINDFLLEIGGEFLARGCKPDAQPWWIELPSPPPLARLHFALTHHALATSGLDEKSSLRLHHLLDPHHSHPTAHPLLKVTVLANTCLQADAWATALYVLGPEKGLIFASEQQIAAVFTSQASHQFSPVMEDMLDEATAQL